MTTSFRQFRGLAHPDKLRFCGIVFFVPVLKICLRVFGFNRVLTFLKSLLPAAAPRKTKKTIEPYRDLMKIYYRLFPATDVCLPISLIFWWMLRREGIETKLYFGMQKEQGNLLAHAWIEHDGIPVTADKNVRRKYKSFEVPLAPTVII